MKVRGKQILKGLLYAVGTAGLVAAALTAPGLFSAIGPFGRFNQSHKNQLKRTFDYAKSSKYVEVTLGPNGYLVTLTSKGLEKYNSLKVDDLKLNKRSKWDGKWRLVVFDIPENKKQNRIIFARKLKDLGMYQMQKSIWAWPYDLTDEVDLIKEVYEVRPFVRIITAEHIDNQKDLLKFFNLQY